MAVVTELKIAHPVKPIVALADGAGMEVATVERIAHHAIAIADYVIIAEMVHAARKMLKIAVIVPTAAAHQEAASMTARIIIARNAEMALATQVKIARHAMLTAAPALIAEMETAMS